MFETQTSTSSLIWKWITQTTKTILNPKELELSMPKTRNNSKAAAKSLTPQGPSTKEVCEVDMVQNRPINKPINNRLRVKKSIISHSEAEEEAQGERARTTGLEARAKRRKREKVGLETESV